MDTALLGSSMKHSTQKKEFLILVPGTVATSTRRDKETSTIGAHSKQPSRYILVFQRAIGSAAEIANVSCELSLFTFAYPIKQLGLTFRSDRLTACR